MISLSVDSDILPRASLVLRGGSLIFVLSLVFKESVCENLKQTCYEPMTVLCLREIWYNSVHTPLRTSPKNLSRKTDRENLFNLSTRVAVPAKTSEDAF